MLATLKDDHLKEKEKQKEIVSLLGPLDDEKFALLSGLGRKVTDYGADKSAAAEGTYMHPTFTQICTCQRTMYLL